MKPQQKKILVVEDNKVIRNEIIDIIEMENYIAIGANNGEEGMQKAKEFLPDMIISDVLMPKLDGLGLIKEIRNNPTTDNIPFIFMSALSDYNNIRQGMLLGADDYLTKPIKIEDLLKTIEQRLNKEEKIKKRINDTRDSILHSLPHELRTPLNSILGFSFLIQSDKESSEKTIEFANYINESGNKLLKIINQYLITTKLLLLQSDNDKIKLLKKSYTNNISGIISEIVKEQNDKYKFDGDIEVKVPASDIKMDKTHFNILMTELISNAIKFTKENKIINITTVEKNKNIEISIENFGCGIKKEQIKEIGSFMQFNRKKQEQQGIGFGLSIVKLIAEIYNLELKFDSEENNYFKVSVLLNL